MNDRMKELLKVVDRAECLTKPKNKQRKRGRPPSVPIELRPKDVKRFWRSVDSSGVDDCWLWNRKAKTTTGYGSFGVIDVRPEDYERTGRRTVNVSAARVAWTIMNGPIPEGLYVLHTCDIRLCCNPSHLYVGTAKDNVADMMRKGRDNFSFRNRKTSRNQLP